MRVLILSPTITPAVTGNAITAERWRQGLRSRGLGVTVARPDALDGSEPPRVVHAHHLFKTGVPALHWLENHDLPLVVSAAGTDLSDDLPDPKRGPLVAAVLQRAAMVVVPAKASADALTRRFAWLQQRLAIVPRAHGHLTGKPFDLRAAAGCDPDHLVFLLPAGVRPVKQNLECLLALAEVQRRRPQVRAVFVGPPLDTQYAQDFAAAVKRNRFATWLGILPPAQMPAALAAADVVLNTSRSEGMSNALLEAIAAGTCTLASDIAANRALLNGSATGEEAGVLFHAQDWQAFVNAALRLVDQPHLRRTLATAARRRAAAWPSAEEEARALENVYRQALEAHTSNVLSAAG